MVSSPQHRGSSSETWSAKDVGGSGGKKPSANLAASTLWYITKAYMFWRQACKIRVSQAQSDGEVPIGWLYPGWLEARGLALGRGNGTIGRDL